MKRIFCRDGALQRLYRFYVHQIFREWVNFGIIYRTKWYNHTTHAEFNARSSQAKAASSFTTTVQRHRLAFMLGITHNKRFINEFIITNYQLRRIQ